MLKCDITAIRFSKVMFLNVVRLKDPPTLVHYSLICIAAETANT